MRRANFRRREQAARHVETQSFQVADDTPEKISSGNSDEPRHVFSENDARRNLFNDATKFGPQISLILDAKTLSGRAVALAREAANDAIHDATKRSRVERA